MQAATFEDIRVIQSKVRRTRVGNLDENRISRIAQVDALPVVLSVDSAALQLKR